MFGRSASIHDAPLRRFPVGRNSVFGDTASAAGAQDVYDIHTRGKEPAYPGIAGLALNSGRFLPKIMHQRRLKEWVTCSR